MDQAIQMTSETVLNLIMVSDTLTPPGYILSHKFYKFLAG